MQTIENQRKSVQIYFLKKMGKDLLLHHVHFRIKFTCYLVLSLSQVPATQTNKKI